MNRKIHFITALLIMAGLIAGSTEVSAQIRPYRVSDAKVMVVLDNIEAGTDRFKRSFNHALDKSRLNNTEREDQLMAFVTSFENSTDRLRQRFAAHESVRSDVTDVLNKASSVNRFMANKALIASAENDWLFVKSNLDTLASYYGVRYDWESAAVSGRNLYRKPYRVNDKLVERRLKMIEAKTDVYKRRMNTALDRSTINNTAEEDRVLDYITKFENATDRLKQKFDANRSVANDVRVVLSEAASVNAFMNRNKMTNASEVVWEKLKKDLDVLAGYYNIPFNWTALPVDSQAIAYTVAGNQVSALLTRLESKTDIYKRTMDTAIDRSFLNNTRSEVSLSNYISQFENATDHLKQRFDARLSTRSDAKLVLDKAMLIDGFMRDYRFMTAAENQWNSLRIDLNTLSNYYGVGFNWDSRYEPADRFNAMLTGTYRLNEALSDDVSVVVRNAINVFPQIRENRIERNLTLRLRSPEILAIQKSGSDVIVASTNAPRVEFKADGVTRKERTSNGREVDVTASTYYNGVALKYDGARENQFYVNFIPLSGNQLKIVRRVELENIDQTVTVASVYDKVGATAEWQMASYRRYGERYHPRGVRDFIVPNGTTVQAALRTPLSTRDSKAGDPFTMEIVSPTRYQGAVIRGHVIDAEGSGVIAGDAGISLDFDTITLANGSTYQFAGLIQDVKRLNGEDLDVDNEGQVEDGNQTKKTITRTSIGAGVGAIIGAILGGTKGAVTGAAIGGAAGAGTVLLQGRESVDLENGTMFLISASAPSQIGAAR